MYICICTRTYTISWHAVAPYTPVVWPIWNVCPYTYKYNYTYECNMYLYAHTYTHETYRGSSNSFALATLKWCRVARTHAGWHGNHELNSAHELSSDSPRPAAFFDLTSSFEVQASKRFKSKSTHCAEYPYYQHCAYSRDTRTIVKNDNPDVGDETGHENTWECAKGVWDDLAVFGRTWQGVFAEPPLLCLIIKNCARYAFGTIYFYMLHNSSCVVEVRHLASAGRA